MVGNAKRNFDTASMTWDENPQRAELARHVAAAILQRAPLNPNSDIMDYGAGTGLVTLELQPYVRSITAVDRSQGMLSVLTDKIREKNITNVVTKQLDFEDEDDLDICFEAIVSSMTLHHIDDVGTLIKRFYELLLPEGYLCIADLDLDDGGFHSDQTGVMHFGFDREKMTQLFQNAGFHSVSIETAVNFTKHVEGKGKREFSIFLITGEK